MRGQWSLVTVSCELIVFTPVIVQTVKETADHLSTESADGSSRGWRMGCLYCWSIQHRQALPCLFHRVTHDLLAFTVYSV